MIRSQAPRVEISRKLTELPAVRSLIQAVVKSIMSNFDVSGIKFRLVVPFWLSNFIPAPGKLNNPPCVVLSDAAVGRGESGYNQTRVKKSQNLTF